MKGFPINSLSFSISSITKETPGVTSDELTKDIKEAIAKASYESAKETEAKVATAMATGIFGGLTVMVNKYLPDDVIIVGEKTYQAMLKLAPYEVGDKK